MGAPNEPRGGSAPPEPPHGSAPAYGIGIRECGLKKQSGVKEVVHGVPQGSKLGPLLFILYINDLSQVIQYCKIHMFADDTLIYFAGTSEQEVVTRVNDELRIVNQWLSSNSLSVNVAKTKCMVMGRSGFIERVESSHSVSLMGSALDWVTKFKYFGVIIDNRLCFKEHAEYVNGKMAKKINILCKLRKILSKGAKGQLFKSIIVPHLRYCFTVLIMVNKSYIEKLQVTFNEGLRAVLKKRRSERVSDMLQEIGYLMVGREVERDVLTFIYRLENGLLPSYLNQLVMKNCDVHQYLTKQASNFHIGRSVRAKRTVNNGVVMYNALPREVRDSTNVGQFRERVALWLRNLESRA